jgi:hypothetical protein
MLFLGLSVPVMTPNTVVKLEPNCVGTKKTL